MRDEEGNCINVLEVHEFVPENLESLSGFEPPPSPPSRCYLLLIMIHLLSPRVYGVQIKSVLPEAHDVPCYTNGISANSNMHLAANSTSAFDTHDQHTPFPLESVSYESTLPCD